MYGKGSLDLSPLYSFASATSVGIQQLPVGLMNSTEIVELGGSVTSLAYP